MTLSAQHVDGPLFGFHSHIYLPNSRLHFSPDFRSPLHYPWAFGIISTTCGPTAQVKSKYLPLATTTLQMTFPHFPHGTPTTPTSLHPSGHSEPPFGVPSWYLCQRKFSPCRGLLWCLLSQLPSSSLNDQDPQILPLFRPLSILPSRTVICVLPSLLK